MTTATRKRTASELIAGNLKLSSPPLIYEKLMKVLDDPRSGSNDLGNVISEDHGLAARILALVNSALFSLPWKVESISAAVRVVGTSQIRDVAVATSVLSMFSDVPSDLIDVDSFRYHSLAVGVGARVIAQQRGRTTPSASSSRACCTTSQAHHHDQRDRGGEGGARRGARDRTPAARVRAGPRRVRPRSGGRTLLEKWTFPDALAEAVRFHHQPRRANRFPVEASCVHIADIMAHALGWGKSGQAVVPEMYGPAWDAMGIDSSALGPLLEDAERQLEAALVLIPGPDPS